MFRRAVIRVICRALWETRHAPEKSFGDADFAGPDPQIGGDQCFFFGDFENYNLNFCRRRYIIR
jgi:hypothetical protein